MKYVILIIPLDLLFMFVYFLLQLRYQKCLDAHPQGAGRGGTGGSHTPGRGLGATLKSLVGALAGRRLRGADS